MKTTIFDFIGRHLALIIASLALVSSVGWTLYTITMMNQMRTALQEIGTVLGASGIIRPAENGQITIQRVWTQADIPAP